MILVRGICPPTAIAARRGEMVVVKGQRRLPKASVKHLKV